jgi:hypothetical protein
MSCKLTALPTIGSAKPSSSSCRPLSMSAHRSATPQRAFEVQVAHHAPPLDQQRGGASEPTPISGNARHDRCRRRRDERLAEEPHMSRQ